LIVEIHYTSPFFAEKLQKYIGSQEEIDFNKKKDTRDYTIDYGKRLVTRKHAKKFKFLTLSPFKIQHRIVFVDKRKFVIQVEILFTTDKLDQSQYKPLYIERV